LTPDAPDTSGSFLLSARLRIVRHLLFWLWVYAMDVGIFGLGYNNVKFFMLMALLEMPTQMFFAYSIMYFILPKYLLKKKMGTALLLFVGVFLVSGVVSHVLFMNFGGYPNEHPPLWDWLKIAMRAFYALLQGSLAVGVKLVLTWYTNEKKLSSMEKSRMASELKMLKDQVNPHFLFNTLNNLYGLVARNTTHAQESILRLSGILHFMLHESNSPTISMQKEIRCIQDYIELEKLRYSGTLSISFNVQEPVRELHVVPLTLFPFVENSFKHGASELIRDAWINIDFSIYKNEFVFKIENSKRALMISPPSGGIGLSNVKRRLELVYEQDHSLQIIDSPETFLVILKIALNRMQNPDQKKYESQMSYRRG
jgi:hypothetical protein